jgi:hypothetical protein
MKPAIYEALNRKQTQHAEISPERNSKLGLIDRDYSNRQQSGTILFLGTPVEK